MINLDDFREEYEEAVSQLHEFVRRAKKGLPSDRWASERQQWLVAKGAEWQGRVLEWTGEALKAAHKALEEMQQEVEKANAKIEDLQAEIERLREYIDGKASPDDGQQP